MSNKGKKYIGLKKISDNSVIKLTSFSGNKITFLSPGTKPVIGYVTEYEFKEETLNFHLNYKNDYNETIYLTGLVKVSLAGGTTYYSVYASNYKESVEAYANDELNTNSEDFFFRNKLNVLSNLNDKQWWNINNPILDYENFENERIKSNKISISNEFDMPEKEKAYKKGPIIEEVENHLKESLNKYSYDELISLHNEDESLINIYKILKRDLLKMGIQLNVLELKTAKKIVLDSNSITDPLAINLKDIHGQKYGYGLTESTNEEKVLKKEYKEPRKTSVVKIDNNIDNNKADNLFNRIVEDDFVVDYHELEQDNKTSEQIIKDNMKALGKSLDDYNKTNHNDDNKVVNYDEKMEEVPVDGMEYNKKQWNEMLEKISADKEEYKTADIKEENNITEPIPVKESINEEKTETAEEVVETSTEEEKVETENSEELAEVEKTQEDVVIENTPIVHDGFISEEIITEDEIVEEIISKEEITDEELESNDNAEEIFREKAVKQLFTDTNKVYTKNHYREIFAAANKIKGKLIKENNELNKENEELVNIICTPKFKTIRDLKKQIDKHEDTILSLKDDREELVGKNKKLKKTNRALNKENDDLCDSIIIYAQDNINLNKTIKDQNEEISELNEIIDEYENNSNNDAEVKTESNKGKIRELEKTIKEQDDLITTLTSERDEYKDKYKKLNKNIAVNSENEDSFNKDKEIDRLKDVVLDKEDLLKDASTSYKKLTEDYNELSLKLEDKDREFNRYKMVNDETIKNNKIQLKEKEDTIKSNMDTIDNLSNQVLSLKKENDDKDNKIAELEAEIKALKNKKEDNNNHKVNNFKIINLNINRIVLVEIDGKIKKYSISINGDLAYDDNYDQEVIINKVINKRIKNTVSSNYSSLKNFKILDYNFDYNKSTLLNGSTTIANNNHVKK